MKNLYDFEDFVNESKWVADVETEFHPKEGIFTKGADEVAKYLKDNSKDLKQAMSRLNFYINRAGSKMDPKDKARLEDAKTKLHNLYESVNNDWEKLNKEVQDLVMNTDKKIKVSFKEELKTDGRKWIITGVSPDKTHGDLKVFYQDSESEPVKKVDFFDFHPDTYNDLLEIVKKYL